jgi:hypothetical protein
MKFPRRTFVVFAFLLAVVFIQFIPTHMDNPPVETEIQTPSEVGKILVKACYDCHSNRTKWPWYGRIAPVSWLLARDVTEAREEINFTTWNRYHPAIRAVYRRKIWEEVKGGHMPPFFYNLMHPEARLSHEEKEALRLWSATP